MTCENVREQTENFEKEILCEDACLSVNTKGRQLREEKCPLRTDFQRDRDRIIHCKAFRRLKHKTQVFLSPAGDYYRTRLTHTLEVSQIARTISRALRLNEDLTEAIALGHDLGHTPFGHAGERALDKLCPGGFHHYEQSLRVVDILEKDGKGLNLTYEVRDGILKHTNMKADTKEGNVVRFSDVIAYLNHDIEDAVRGGIIKETDIPEKIRKVLGNSKSERITTLVTSIINNGTEEIKMDEEIYDAYMGLKKYMYENVYFNPKCKSEEIKVEDMIEKMYDHYVNNIEKLPARYLNLAYNYGIDKAICDYISGMSDDYAVETFKNLFIPAGWTKY